MGSGHLESLEGGLGDNGMGEETTPTGHSQRISKLNTLTFRWRTVYFGNHVVKRIILSGRRFDHIWWRVAEGLLGLEMVFQ